MRTAGSEKPLTLAKLDAVLGDDQRPEEQRAQDRVNRRLRTQVICLPDDNSTVRCDVSLGWTVDVSTTGAKLVLSRSVSADRFWVRFLGEDVFIECRVQWREDTPAGANSRRSGALHRCGVRFERILNREEFEKVLTDVNRSC